MQTLKSAGVAQGNAAKIVADLQALFPHNASSSAETLNCASVDDLPLSNKCFRKALRGGGRGSAPGFSGWRYEHLRSVLQLAGGASQILPIAQLLVDGAVPSATLELLAASALTPLAKPNAGVRPLAVGEVLRRVTARAICMQSRSALSADLRPHQFAVGVRGGGEIIY